MNNMEINKKMKKIISAVGMLFALQAFTLSAQTGETAELKERVSALIKQLTVEEKSTSCVLKRR